MAKYSKRASNIISKTMRDFSRKTLHSGKYGRKVTSRRQAIAIALSKPRSSQHTMLNKR